MRRYSWDTDLLSKACATEVKPWLHRGKKSKFPSKLEFFADKKAPTMPEPK